MAPAGEASGRMAREMDATVIAVIAYREGMGLEEARAARQLFGERLAGVVINGVTRYKSREVSEQLTPLFQAQNVKVLASIPEDRRLLGATAGQIADHLGGTFLDWEEKRDNFVEHYLIGGMVLDWGVLYFQQFDNKAVIVRGNRPDLQMAALRTPTSCIVLTGGYPPIQYVSYEAGEEEVPLIQVETDTLETAAALESLQGAGAVRPSAEARAVPRADVTPRRLGRFARRAGRLGFATERAESPPPSLWLPTHTSPPWNTSFFQMGTIVLMRSSM